MLLTAGNLNVQRRMVDDAIGKKITKIVIGTSDTPVTAGDTAITNPVSRDVDSITYPSPGYVQVSATFTESDPAMTVREVGLLNGDNVLVHRKVVPDTVKSAGLSLIVNYRIKVQ
jgi:hypothetical protein